MEYKILILFGMIFLHVVDDFYLQPGILSNLKQKDWWKENAPNELYKHDYLAALFIHSFSWAFMVMLLPGYWAISTVGFAIIQVIIAFSLNLVVHMVVDHLKANLKKINLIQDQLIHLGQMIATWAYLVVIR